MAANSKHYGDVIIWLRKVLHSCNTTKQVRNTRNLFSNFEKQYNSEYSPLQHSKFSTLNDEIRDLYRDAIFKYDELFQKEIELKTKTK